MTQKNILMLAADNEPEALRMAAGLTLLDDKVSVIALAPLPETNEVNEQLDALAFSEVPVTIQPVSDESGATVVARALLSADVVFVV